MKGTRSGRTYSEKRPRQETHCEHGDSFHRRAIFLALFCNGGGGCRELEIYLRVLLGHELIDLSVSISHLFTL